MPAPAPAQPAPPPRSLRRAYGSCALLFFLLGQVGGRVVAALAVRPLGSLGLVGEVHQRLLALDDAESACAVLLLDALVERARLVDVGCDVRRERRRDLAVPCEAERELDLLDRRDH